MEVRIIDNQDSPLGDLLRSKLSGSTAARIATAFLNSNGLEYVLKPIHDLLARDGRVSIVHGADLHITNADAMRRLAELSMDSDSMTYQVFFDADFLRKGRFHSKIYLVDRTDGSCHAVVGSSNLTGAGLSSNMECNCVIEGIRGEAAIDQCFTAFSRLEGDPSSFAPSGEWIAKYERASSIAQRISFRENAELNELVQDLRRPGQVPHWEAQSQSEFAIQALQQLELDRPGGYFSLIEIGAKTWELVVAAGKTYDRGNWENSIRRVMNTNTVGKRNLQVFERQGGEQSRSGRYRLSQKGRSYQKPN